MKATRNTLIAAAVGMALAGSANAGLVKFDVNGQGVGADANGVDVFIVSLFDWKPGNLLLHDITPAAGVTLATNPHPVYAQGQLGTLSGNGDSFSYSMTIGNPSGAGGAPITGQLTYQLRLWVEVAAGTGTSTDLKPAAAPAGSSSFLEIYYNPTAIANDISGCGYGSNQTANCAVVPSKLIYKGAATLKSTVNLTDDGVSAGGLDQNGVSPDADNGITTNTLQLGTMSINADTLFADPLFFISDISSLPTDIIHTEQGGGAPFLQANPSNEVVGQAIFNGGAGGGGAGGSLTDTYGGDLHNNTGGGSCSDAGGTVNTLPCDVHLQSDASSTPQGNVPEPDTLALLGLGLAGLGFRLRRRVTGLLA